MVGGICCYCITLFCRAFGPLNQATFVSLTGVEFPNEAGYLVQDWGPCIVRSYFVSSWVLTPAQTRLRARALTWHFILVGRT